VRNVLEDVQGCLVLDDNILALPFHLLFYVDFSKNMKRKTKERYLHRSNKQTLLCQKGSRIAATIPNANIFASSCREYILGMSRG
jgi:hypothetical protein